MQQRQQPTDGYIIVASKKHNFYLFAINLAESIRDHYPEANICLVTEPQWVDARAEVADVVLHCDNHYRAKLDGMARTPWDRTFYIDADAEVVHEDIKTVFDLFDGNDLVFTGLPEDREYIFVETTFPAGRLNLCGGVCLYDSSNPLVMEFMSDWYELFKRQWANEWWPLNENGEWDVINFPRSLKSWDQFSLWWLTNRVDKYKDLKIGIFEDDARWNYYTKLWEHKQHTAKPPIVMHYSSGCNKDIDVAAY